MHSNVFTQEFHSFVSLGYSPNIVWKNSMIDSGRWATYLFKPKLAAHVHIVVYWSTENTRVFWYWTVVNDKYQHSPRSSSGAGKFAPENDLYDDDSRKEKEQQLRR